MTVYNDDYSPVIALARRLAVTAGQIIRAQGAVGELGTKHDGSIVTETDHAIQSRAVTDINESFPDHAIIAEEDMSTTSHLPDPEAARFCWVIDPLDGTRNYAAGFPCYSTSIAVLDRGVPVVGVVAEHCVGDLYEACRNKGATRNSTSITVGADWDMPDIMIGVPSSKDSMTVQVVSSWAAAPGIVTRNIGSTAVHLGLVASGALTAAFCKRSKIWDIAAGHLLVREAGGVITYADGTAMDRFDLRGDHNSDTPFVASTPSWHSRLVDSIA